MTINQNDCRTFTKPRKLKPVKSSSFLQLVHVDVHAICDHLIMGESKERKKNQYKLKTGHLETQLMSENPTVGAGTFYLMAIFPLHKQPSKH